MSLRSAGAEARTLQIFLALRAIARAVAKASLEEKSAKRSKRPACQATRLPDRGCPSQRAALETLADRIHPSHLAHSPHRVRGGAERTVSSPFQLTARGKPRSPVLLLLLGGVRADPLLPLRPRNRATGGNARATELSERVASMFLAYFLVDAADCA